MTASVDPRGRALVAGSTSERLVDAAERLVAQHGLAVSDRAILRAAGQRNNSAIAYHFGTRQGLLDAVWHRRTAVTNAWRADLLARLRAEDRIDDVRALVEAYAAPLTSLMAQLSPSYWARFNERVLQERPLVFAPYVQEELDHFDGTTPLQTTLELIALLQKVSRGGVEPGAERRVALAVRYLIGSLAAWERDVGTATASAESLPGLAEELVTTMTALLRA